DEQRFPEEFQKNIVGHLLPEDIGVAYKGYTYSLNLNSVKQSQSMFARRVFELLASNTLVISNYSRGLRLLFGDLILGSDGADSLTERLNQIDNQLNGSDRLRQLGIRKIFREHTYKHRLRQILNQAGVQVADQESQTVLLISFVHSSQQVDSAVYAAMRQNYPAIHLLLVGEVSNLPLSHGIDITIVSDIDEASSSIKELTFSFVGFLDPTSWYGPEYVGDILD